MISAEQEAKILRLFHAEQWRPNTIARQLGVHHSTVRRVLAQAGQESLIISRPSILDPYMGFLTKTLESYPQLTAARLCGMIRARGYQGSEAHLRAIVARIRPRPKHEAYLRLRTLPGEQAQVDWAHFGKIRVGRAERRLYGFVMVLSYSRAIFLRFYLGHDHTAFFMRGHQEAFAFFGGVPRTLLYDNLKSAVLERVAKEAGWGQALPAGRARGIALQEAFGSICAQVAEVSVEGGQVRVHRVVAAIDCGVVVNPDTVEAQVQGSIVFGLTAALFGEVTLAQGRVQQSSFTDYPMLKLAQMPRIEVHILRNAHPPGGVGEPGVPPVAPAVANALFALTGQRLRSLPLRLASA